MILGHANNYGIIWCLENAVRARGRGGDLEREGEGDREREWKTNFEEAKFFDFPWLTIRFGRGDIDAWGREAIGGVRIACSNWSASTRCSRLSVASSAPFPTVAARATRRVTLGRPFAFLRNHLRNHLRGEIRSSFSRTTI